MGQLKNDLGTLNLPALARCLLLPGTQRPVEVRIEAARVFRSATPSPQLIDIMIVTFVSE
jgi:hypothetical protein